jgi:predicted ABC-type ATPase
LISCDLSKSTEPLVDPVVRVPQALVVEHGLLDTQLRVLQLVQALAAHFGQPELEGFGQLGDAVAIYYFSLPNAQLALRRVKMRTAMGEHDVPADVLRRRFARSLHNFFNLYMPLADEWTMFDNSISPCALTVAASRNNQLTVTEIATWNKLKKGSQAA